MVILTTRSFDKAIYKIYSENKSLYEEILEKIELFKKPSHHKQLKVHKLHGKMQDFYSFSVDYAHRIVFKYQDKKTVVLMAFGDHDIYK